MEKSDILALYEYNYWANHRVLDAALQLTPAQYTMPASLSHGSLQSTLVHTLGAEVLWRQRCQEGTSPTSLLSESDFPTLERLRERWQAEAQTMLAFLLNLSDADLQKRIQYKNTKGVPYEETLWKILVHLVNHGTQSRAEAAVALTTFGQSPGDLDLILYFRESG
jgi:uncharacterized damage-inducible protein DinB